MLEEVVTEAHGAETWDALLQGAGLEGAYTSLGSYGDEELLALVAEASKAREEPPDDVVRWFGRSAIPHFAERYPALFEPHSNAADFLLTINDIIHPQVRKLYPGAEVPVFEYERTQDDLVMMGYRSKRQMCAFGEGLIEGAGDHYGQRAEVTQPECVHRGDRRCLFEVRIG